MRPLVIVHADAFTTFIVWTVLEPAHRARLMVVSVRTIQQYWHLLITGNGPTSL